MVSKAGTSSGPKRVDGFFYGLFMDEEILRDHQIIPENPRPAYVEDFALIIGNRATLVPTPSARAYGMIYALTHDEMGRLYSGPGLKLYRPEAVIARSLEQGDFPAMCFNLEEAPGPDESNVEYAVRLNEALRKLNFPADYIASLV